MADLTGTETPTETGTETVVATETPAETPETVSKERFDEQQAKLTEAQETNELLRQNQAIIAANVPQAPAAEAFDIYAEVGLKADDPTDIPNQEQLKRINAHFQAVTNSSNAQIRFLIEHPDYTELVGTAEQIKSGQFAGPLKEAIRANPTLMATIGNSPDRQAAAYSIAKLYADKNAGTKIEKSESQEVIDEAVNNAARVKTGANVAGGEGLSEAGRLATISDADFVKMANKVGADL